MDNIKQNINTTIIDCAMVPSITIIQTSFSSTQHTPTPPTPPLPPAPLPHTHPLKSIAKPQSHLYSASGSYLPRPRSNRSREHKLTSTRNKVKRRSLHPLSSSKYTMCFYDQQIFACGDYKWSRFRAHCAKEYRTGETCGMKLIYETSRVTGKCQMCKKYEVTYRKIIQAVERVQRWENEGINPVSTDKERQSIMIWQNELKEIEYMRAAKMKNI